VRRIVLLRKPTSRAMDHGLQQHVQSYLLAENEILGGHTNTKESRERKKEAKQAIIAVMKALNVTYVEVQGQYFVIGSKVAKPIMNGEFVKQAYMEFHKEIPGLLESTAQAFALYLFAMQKHLAQTTEELKCSKKKPMIALLFDHHRQQEHQQHAPIG
jgi:hypothetical protein